MLRNLKEISSMVREAGSRERVWTCEGVMR